MAFMANPGSILHCIAKGIVWLEHRSVWCRLRIEASWDLATDYQLGHGLWARCMKL